MSDARQFAVNRDTFVRYLMPGIWVDANGHHHLALPEMLAHCGLPDTPENRRLVTECVRELMAAHSPEMKVVERPQQADKN